MEGQCYIKSYRKKRMTFKEICKRCVYYVKKRYRQNCSVMFDRHSGNASTKDTTHLRRSKGKLLRLLLCTGNTIFNMKKEECLLNLKNQQCFLEMLATEMNTAGMCAMQPSRHADTLIATNAVDIANSKPTVIIGEDTDLLILLIRLVNKKRYRMIFFYVRQ